MQSKMVSHRLIANVTMFIIALSLIGSAVVMGISISGQRTFSGIVYASSGVPVSGAIVTASGTEGSGYAITNSLGQYSITEGLKTGNYTVNVVADGYLQSEVENVPVIVGQETPGINFYLNLSGGISGRVTEAVSGVPLEKIMIVAYEAGGGGAYGWYAITDANGNYSIIANLQTGTYNVSAIFPEGYAMKTLGGVTVTAGAMTKGINLALEPSGVISGRVTATPSGLPLENATVSAVSDDGKYFGYAQTNATGHYKMSSGLGTGTYTVYAYKGGSFDQATDVNVTAGLETSNIDLELTFSAQASGIITGKVTDADDKPIVGALVSAFGPGGSGEDSTDENGNYAISSGLLGDGNYTVVASAIGYSEKNVTDVSVTVNQVTPNINFKLSRIPPAQSGRISGMVQGEANPIPEYAYPILVLLIATLATAMLAKLSNVKAKHAQLRSLKQ